MKLLIAADMEGITGVVSWKHVDPTAPDYARFRRLMTGDVNAAVQGAAEAGFEEIVISDGHNTMDNILIEELDPRARLNSGSPAQYSMLKGIDQGVDAAMFIGYHARMGTPSAILDHTWSSSRVQNVWLNGRPVGEIGLNASLCGYFGVPVIMLSGDQSAGQEAADWVQGIETIAVKRAAGRSTAELLPPTVTQQTIREKAVQVSKAFRNGKKPAAVTTQTPVNITVEFFSSDMADKVALIPWSTRLDGRRIELVLPDMAAAYRAFQAAVALA